MKIYDLNNLSKETIKALCTRAIVDDAVVAERVKAIIETVKRDGDAALFAYTKAFDRVALSQLYLDEEAIGIAAAKISPSVKSAIDIAYKNIRVFHKMQLMEEQKIETMPGVMCWREARPIDAVGLYIPGGTAVLPSTFLMLGIPARLAGCREITVCSPAQAGGAIDPSMAYVATLLDIKKIYCIGGAQAVAAMAFGTESIAPVNKIFGPGNRYVTEAKKQVQPFLAIDMPAGPSEVLILADDTADASFIAADLLAQAEHGTDSQAILVSTAAPLIEQVQVELENQLSQLPRKELARQALDNSFIIKADCWHDALSFSNTYAPEHLILATESFEELIPQVSSAGSVFLGNLSPESVGDYASGTNHTLPTGGFARSYSGVSVDTFLKKITFQQLSAEGLKNIAETVETLAETEGLMAHKQAVTLRLNQIEVK